MSFCTHRQAGKTLIRCAAALLLGLAASDFLAAANETNGTPAANSPASYSFAAAMSKPLEASLTSANAENAATGRYMLLSEPAATTAAPAANEPEPEPGPEPALAYEPATEVAGSTPTPAVYYEPKFRSNWTWPGWPDTEALRRHLLSDRVNHGQMNNTAEKRSTIRKLKGWQLQQLHASHHDRMLQPELITMMQIFDSGTTTTSTTTTSIATKTATSTATADCPDGNCPTAGTMLYQPRLRARRQTRRLLRWR